MKEIINLSSSKLNRKPIASIDMAKFICSILVVVIHANPLTDVNSDLAFILSDYLGRIAVPFFFVCSGYFCFRKTTLENFDYKIPLKYTIRIIKLYVIWTLIYLPAIIYIALHNDQGMMYGFLLGIKDILLVGYLQLWYLHATVVATLLITIALINKIKVKSLIIIGGLLYIVGLLADTYYGVLEYMPVLKIVINFYLNIFNSSRSGVLVGLLYMSIGVVFAYQKITLNKIIFKLSFIVSMILMFVEAHVVKKYCLAFQIDFYIFLVPVTFLLFYLVINIKIKPSNFTNILRTYSSLIYFMHMLVIFPVLSILVNVIEELFDKPNFEFHSLTYFLIVIIVSIIISTLIIQLQKYQQFQWLRNLY